MNLQHMKYAVEVADTKSINKAAEKLFVGQSNLSRAIKELEAGLGTAVFDRSAKGMSLTPDGEVFIQYARAVLKQVDDIEHLFSKGEAAKKRFSVSAPRASYVAKAFAEFSLLIEKGEKAELFYRETNSMRTIKNILEDDYKLGILRYAENYDRYYKSMMDEKGLEYELVTQFSYMLVMSENSPVANKEDIRFKDLKPLMEIAHADPYVPSLPFAEVKKEELHDNSDRQIFVFERSSQFELLSKNPETYMWVSPLPKEYLTQYGLIQRTCGENSRVYRDMLIHKKEYTLTNLDKMFIEQLVKTKREVFGREE